MTQIHNQDIIQKLSKDAQLQPGIDNIPMTLSPVVAPVLQVNPLKTIKVVTGVANNATSATIFTASTTKRTFITGLELTVTKDVTATSNSSSIACTPAYTGLGTSTLLNIFLQTLTVLQGSSVSLNLGSNPIEVQPGTNVVVTNSTNVANVISGGTVYYYEE